MPFPRLPSPFERCAPSPVLFWPISLKKSFIIYFGYPRLISIRQSNSSLNIFFFFFFFIQKNNRETWIWIHMHIFLCTLLLILSLRELLFTGFIQIFVTIRSLYSCTSFVNTCVLQTCTVQIFAHFPMAKKNSQFRWKPLRLSKWRSEIISSFSSIYPSSPPQCHSFQLLIKIYVLSLERWWNENR